jgi:hypothetical protein
MRFLDVHVPCPVCELAIVANEPGSKQANCIMRAVLAKEVTPYDAFAYYRGALVCPGCKTRIGVTFRDAIRRYTPRTEVQAIRILDPDDGFIEDS